MVLVFAELPADGGAAGDAESICFYIVVLYRIKPMLMRAFGKNDDAALLRRQDVAQTARP
uniref:Uncharacterized protein n=1 Tax=Conchiformibius kuhniae TaxID=211502 RepID=A0A8T9MSM0_9NEIS|nr:hypothetical protein LVJ77_06210 [Conchiformibius kuhniae]